MPYSVSARQLELLLDFMEKHIDLAFGRVRGKESSVRAKLLWSQCAELLNSQFDGTQKSAEKWKKYFNQYKSRVRAKLKTMEQIETGVSTDLAWPSVTVLEARLCAILGKLKFPDSLPVQAVQCNMPRDNLRNDQSELLMPVNESHDESFCIELDDEDDDDDINVVGVDKAVNTDLTAEDPSTKESPSKIRRCDNFTQTQTVTEETECRITALQEADKQENDLVAAVNNVAAAVNRTVSAIEAGSQQLKRLADLQTNSMLMQQANWKKGRKLCKNKSMVIMSSSSSSSDSD